MAPVRPVPPSVHCPCTCAIEKRLVHESHRPSSGDPLKTPPPSSIPANGFTKSVTLLAGVGYVGSTIDGLNPIEGERKSLAAST